MIKNITPENNIKFHTVKQKYFIRINFLPFHWYRTVSTSALPKLKWRHLKNRTLFISNERLNTNQPGQQMYADRLVEKRNPSEEMLVASPHLSSQSEAFIAIHKSSWRKFHLESRSAKMCIYGRNFENKSHLVEHREKCEWHWRSKWDKKDSTAR